MKHDKRCARATYYAALDDAFAAARPWEELAEWWQRQYRRHARTILTEALQPGTLPLDGQEALL